MKNKPANNQSAQHQYKQPGIESEMRPEPDFLAPSYQGSNKLLGKTALITGGDSGIGRAVACAFAIEGADVILHYLNEHGDAKKTKQLVEDLGGKCWLEPANLQTYSACEELIEKNT